MHGVVLTLGPVQVVTALLMLPVEADGQGAAR